MRRTRSTDSSTSTDDGHISWQAADLNVTEFYTKEHRDLKRTRLDRIAQLMEDRHNIFYGAPTAKVAQRKNDKSIGYDLFVHHATALGDKNWDIDTGTRINWRNVPRGYFVQLKNSSGLWYQGDRILEGVIDRDWNENIHVHLHTDKLIPEHHSKVGQAVILKYHCDTSTTGNAKRTPIHEKVQVCPFVFPQTPAGFNNQIGLSAVPDGTGETVPLIELQNVQVIGYLHNTYALLEQMVAQLTEIRDTLNEIKETEKAIAGDVRSLDVKIENPMPVVGI